MHSPQSVEARECAVALTNIPRCERLTATGATALARKFPPTVSVQRPRAVWADDAKVLQAMVVSDPVDVVEDQRHPATSPDLALAAQLTAALLESSLVEPLLQRPAWICGTADEDFAKRPPVTLVRARPNQVRVEVVNRDLPVLGPVLQSPDVVADRPIAECPQRIGPAERAPDRVASLILGERCGSPLPGHERMFAFRPDGPELGSQDSNPVPELQRLLC